jgi:hypothetical protein
LDATSGHVLYALFNEHPRSWKMTNNEVYDDQKPEDPRPVGRVNNELEHITELGKALLPKEIGVVNNDTPGEGTPAEPEIGRTNNERSDKEKPANPEIGVINNERKSE